LVNYL